MKILLFDNASMTAKEGKYFTNSLNGLFINQLIASGHKITYYQFAIVNNNSINAFDLKENGVNCYPLKFYKNKLLRYFIAYFKLVPQVLKNDFIYFYYPTSFKYATIICNLLGKRYGIYIRGMEGVFSKFSNWVYRHAYTIFTVSDFFTLSVNQIVGKDIANTIRPMIPFTANDIVINREYEIEGRFKILFLGRITKDKGIAELLEAVSELKKKHYNLTLNIVGNGDFMQKAQKTMQDKNIEDVTNFKGAIFQQEAIQDYYMNADVYVIPTYHEGFPRTLYESMIFGTPIITTFVGGIPGIMKDEYNCKEIKPKSVDSIVEVLEFAMNNYSRMIEYAKNGTSTVLKIIDSERMEHAQHLNLILKKYDR